MFNRIFVGVMHDNMEEWITKPHVWWVQNRYKELDVEMIATEVWMKLINSDREFNFSYFKLKLSGKCNDEYRKRLTMLKRQTKGLNTGDIKTDEYTQEGWEAPVIAWKEPLTEAEATMVSCLEDGMTQREIYAQNKIHPKVQGELRKSIKNKIEVTKWYEGEQDV